MIHRSFHTSIRAALIALAALVPTACGTSAGTGTGGASGASPGEVVAQVGTAPITRAAVSHWMNALAGSGYYELMGKRTIPDGLVSDPPNYRRCVNRLEAVAATTHAGAPRPTGIALLGKCQQLYQAMRTRAATFLVDTQWAIASDRELGITATNPEVLHLLELIKKDTLHTDAVLQQYLAATRLTLTDYLLEVRLELLAQKAQRLIQTEGSHTALARFNEAWLRATQRTTCRRGYVVEHCNQYKRGPTYPNSPSAAVVLEQLAPITTGHCYNLTVCSNHH